MFCVGNFCLLQVGSILTALVVCVISYLKWRQNYWQRFGFPVYLSKSLLFGSADNIFESRKTPLSAKFAKCYKEMKDKGYKHFGMYFISQPIYVVIDLDYLKNIMSKDFNNFVDRAGYYNEKDDHVSAHLFAIGGKKWRNLRAKLSPTFTSGKMKMMFPTVIECGNILDGVMSKLHQQNEPINIKEVLGCYTTDIIGSCAFGLNCNTFEDKDSLFRSYGKRTFTLNRWDQIKFPILNNFPNLARKLRLKMLDPDVTKFFTKVIRDSIDYREKNNVTRKDFLQLLIDLNKQDDEGEYKHDGKSLTFEEIVAQCFVFFVAGFETSSTTMTFALYELASNLDVQEKVRQEVHEVMKKYNGEITYDSINEMKYMNQVVEETLRKYPPVPILTRKCGNDYKVPGTDLILEKGTRVYIPIIAIQRDPEYYPEPEKFDPERLSEANKHSRHRFAHIPFGEGPRICIGSRFGLMKSKVGLIVLLNKYKFTINQQTQEPIKMNPRSFILAVEGDVWLNAEKL